ncbi:MAG: sigma-70 family RNA polymerase sigma factor [Oscillospiraceae bacterium]|nr:sigma-70 family RNA polymerase sigma factor [Oscillospiraceae bacterium]
MEDQEILALLDRRDEAAIPALQEAYGAYCRKIAAGILERPEDCEECLNDLWHQAWRHLPGNPPRELRLYLAAATRNLCVSRYRAQTAEKRGGRSALLLEELSECITDGRSAEDAVLQQELARAVNDFLKTLSARSRDLFLRRYFYAESIQEIAARYRLREGAVYMSLSRTRMKLRKYLQKGGYLE